MCPSSRWLFAGSMQVVLPLLENEDVAMFERELQYKSNERNIILKFSAKVPEW